MRRSLDELFSGPFATTTPGNQEVSFVPSFEAGWTDEKLNLRVILPGVSEKDVRISVQGYQLLVEGERKAPEGFSTNGGFSSLPYGKFFRAIDLPSRLDLDKVNCRLRDGVLDIEIPVKAEMKPRVIPIDTGYEERKALAA